MNLRPRQVIESAISLEASGNDLVIKDPSTSAEIAKLYMKPSGLVIDSLHETITSNLTFNDGSSINGTGVDLEITSGSGTINMNNIVSCDQLNIGDTKYKNGDIEYNSASRVAFNDDTLVLTGSDNSIALTTTNTTMNKDLDLSQNTLYNCPWIVNSSQSIKLFSTPSLLTVSSGGFTFSGNSVDLDNNDLTSANIIECSTIETNELRSDSPSGNILLYNPLNINSTTYGDSIEYNSKNLFSFSESLAASIITLGHSSLVPTIKSGTNSLIIDLSPNVMSFASDGASIIGDVNLNYHQLSSISGIYNYNDTSIPISVNDNNIMTINDESVSIQNDGPVTFELLADINNNDESANPLIYMSQDGGYYKGWIGLTRGDNELPNGGTCYGAKNNSLILNSNNSTTIAGTGNVIIAPNSATNNNKFEISSETTRIGTHPMIIDQGQRFWLSNVSTSYQTMRLLTNDVSADYIQWDMILRKSYLHGFKISTDADSTGNVTIDVRIYRDDGNWTASGFISVPSGSTTLARYSGTFTIADGVRYYLSCRSETNNGREVMITPLFEPLWN